MVRDFVAYAGAHGIKVVGLRMPETREFQAASAGLIDPEAERFVRSLRIPVLDYSVAFADRREMFLDADHLNDVGAEVLSGQVAADIRRMFVYGTRTAVGLHSEAFGQREVRASDHSNGVGGFRSCALC